MSDWPNVRLGRWHVYLVPFRWWKVSRASHEYWITYHLGPLAALHYRAPTPSPESR